MPESNSQDTPGFSRARLLAAVGIALAVTVSTLAAALLGSRRFDSRISGRRVGIISTEIVGEKTLDDLSRASIFYGELNRIDPDPRHLQVAAAAEFSLGEYYTEKDPDLALKHFRACVDFLEDYLHGWPWFRMGTLLASDGLYTEADDCFAQTMRIDDGRLGLLASYERGKIAMRRYQPERAWDFFYDFLRFYPHPFEDYHYRNMSENIAYPRGRGLYVMGCSLLGLGKTNLARHLLNKYIQEFPDDISGKFYAAQTGLQVSPPSSIGTDLLQTNPHISTNVRIDRGGADFFSSGRLMFDVYIPEGEISACLLIKAHREIENTKLFLSILVNGQSLSGGRFEILRTQAITLRPCFALRRGRNILEVALLCSQNQPGPVLRLSSVFLSADESP